MVCLPKWWPLGFGKALGLSVPWCLLAVRLIIYRCSSSLTSSIWIFNQFAEWKTQNSSLPCEIQKTENQLLFFYLGSFCSTRTLDWCDCQYKYAIPWQAKERRSKTTNIFVQLLRRVSPKSFLLYQQLCFSSALELSYHIAGDEWSQCLRIYQLIHLQKPRKQKRTNSFPSTPISLQWSCEHIVSACVLQAKLCGQSPLKIQYNNNVSYHPLIYLIFLKEYMNLFLII